MISIHNIVAGIALSFWLCAASATEPTRIDASTDESAQQSWDKMLGESSDETKCGLRAALVEITAATGPEKGLYGLSFHAALQDPSVARVRDKIAGLSPGQVIDLGTQLSHWQTDCGNR